MRHRRDGQVKVVDRDEAVTVIAVVTILAVLGLIGFLMASSIARSATSRSATVSLGKTALGQILVNSRGHTIYLFAKDKNGKSSCSGECARFWPPVLNRGKTTVGPGLKASLLGTTKRSNGSRQVTYNRHPLYTFVMDKRPGQTMGENFFAYGAKWYAVSAKGRMVVSAPPKTTTSPPTTTTTPYPYP
jgi:predicted lipoprotein with Yx(FWY)xxD motif